MEGHMVLVALAMLCLCGKVESGFRLHMSSPLGDLGHA